MSRLDHYLHLHPSYLVLVHAHQQRYASRYRRGRAHQARRHDERANRAFSAFLDQMAVTIEEDARNVKEAILNFRTRYFVLQQREELGL